MKGLDGSHLIHHSNHAVNSFRRGIHDHEDFTTFFDIKPFAIMKEASCVSHFSLVQLPGTALDARSLPHERHVPELRELEPGLDAWHGG